MILKEFRVSNFRSVIDSGPVKVSEITALIGSNEAGKSSILEGLHSISLDGVYGYFDLTQLQGVQKKLNDGVLSASDIEIIECKFELSNKEKSELNKKVNWGGSKFLLLTKYYDEHYKLSYGENECNLSSSVKLREAKKEVLDIINVMNKKINDPSSRGYRYYNEEAYNELYGQIVNVFKNTYEIKQAQNGVSLLTQYLKIENITEIEKNAINDAISRIKKVMNRDYIKNELERQLYKFISTNMPRTVYFKTYERLEDNVSLTELKNNPSAHQTFHNFLKLAEINLDTVARLKDETHRQVYIETACGKATKMLREAWKQEELDIELRLSKDRFLIFTKNSKAVETLLPPSLGSEGFQWFLGFYINFGAQTNAEYKRAILLLDDPGVFLHPSGHKDLLSLFEGYLENDVTTIYSTHLPFLISRDKLDRIRLVHKSNGDRTEVTEKFYSASNKDLLYPIRANLGVTLADSLLIGAKTILVEGYSDQILIQGMMKKFNAQGKRIIDVDNVGVICGMGASGYREYASLLWLHNLPFVVILDHDDEGRKAIKDLVKNGINKKNLLLLSKKDKELPNFDMEDLFSVDTYSSAFFNIHGKHIEKSKDEIIAEMESGTKKYCSKAKRLLKKSGYDLDKIKIAYEIINILNLRKKINKVEHENFDALFNEIDEKIGLYLTD